MAPCSSWVDKNVYRPSHSSKPANNILDLNPFYDDEAIMYPELWSPTTQAFTVMAPMVVPRVYHSVALLLPNGTVFSGGGGLCGGCSQNHFDGQIFSPPYLFTSAGVPAPRPVINSVTSSTVLVGGTITATTGGSVSSWAMVRMGSTTHTVDTDQRRVPLTATANGNTYAMTVPSDPGVALPGYWMLFAINAAGTPSVAMTIQVVPLVPIG
jgi:galactose oxidase